MQVGSIEITFTFPLSNTFISSYPMCEVISVEG